MIGCGQFLSSVSWSREGGEPMDVAFMKAGRDSPRLITAEDLQGKYGARVPRGIRFTCPNCGQPVEPRAMSRGGFQSPHFRHEQNNEIAKQCDLYASGVGGYGGWEYQQIPMPMFIHKLTKTHDHFVVEGGFKSVDQSVLEVLARSHARLAMGMKRYDVSSQRFGSGIARIPFEDISLSPSDNIRLISSPLRFEEVWSPPEDAIKAMVFTCERDTLQGKRLRLGESVCAGDTLFLLAPLREKAAIMRAFSDSGHVGFAGSVMGSSKLQVYKVTLPSNAGCLDREAAYLSSCGILVDAPRVEPELLWPPSLSGDGSVRPLFSNSSCFFGVHTTQPTGSIFVSDDPGSIRYALPNMLIPTDGHGYACLVLEPSSTARLVLAMPDTSEGSVLVDANSPDAIASLSHTGGIVSIDNDDNTIRIVANSPVTVVWLRKGHAWEKLDLTIDATRHEKAIFPGELVKVVRQLRNSPWLLTIWEHDPECQDTSDSPRRGGAEAGPEARKGLLDSLLPRDKRFAMARASGRLNELTTSKDKEFVLKRSGSR